MKALFPLLTLIVFSFAITSCTKDENSVMDASIEWSIGANLAQDTSFFLPASLVDQNQLVIVNNSLCPSHLIKYTLIDDDDIIQTDTIDPTVASIELDFDQSVQLRLITSVVPRDKGTQVDCVWLGQVEFSYQYKSN